VIVTQALHAVLSVRFQLRYNLANSPVLSPEHALIRGEITMTALKQGALAALLALVAFPAGAQGMFGRTQIPRGVFNPVVGAGAVYEMQGSDQQKRTMEFAIVGKESVGGQDGYWLEFTIGGTPMGDVVAKELAVVSEGNMTMNKIIMQMPGRPPMEMPAQMNRNQVNLADVRNKADDLGTESVTTPAGTFSCHHYKMKDGSGEAWVSEKVHPFGLVKYQEKDSTTVLVKTLTDVKDKVAGTPQPFNPMMMMPQQNN
jgi:hypothetical protein